MHTVQTGRQFMKVYQEKTGELLSAEEFYKTKLWPVFFNCEDEYQLLQVGNSDFFQPGHKSKAEQNHVPLPAYRYQKFLENVAASQKGGVSGALAVGYWASGQMETTSGQVSAQLLQNPSTDEIYLSWIGAALGIGFGGGFDIAIIEPAILWFIYEGWPFYRRLLNETPGLKGRQIETWNGLWMLYGFGSKSAEHAYRLYLSNKDKHFGKADNGKIKLDRPDWTEQTVALSRAYGGNEPLLLQVYSFGQTNTTLGQLFLAVPRINNLMQLYDHLIAENPKALGKRPLEDVLKTKYTLKNACATGGIGLRALTPKEIDRLLQPSNKAFLDLEALDKFYQKDIYQFTLNLSWIITMLNNDEIVRLAEDLADELKRYAELGKTSKSTERDKMHAVETLLSAKNKSGFIQSLAEIAGEISNPSPIYPKTGKLVSASMPGDNFTLFLGLVRLLYVYHRNGGQHINHISIHEVSQIIQEQN